MAYTAVNGLGNGAPASSEVDKIRPVAVAPQRLQQLN